MNLQLGTCVWLCRQQAPIQRTRSCTLTRSCRSQAQRASVVPRSAAIDGYYAKVWQQQHVTACVAAQLARAPGADHPNMLLCALRALMTLSWRQPSLRR